MKKTGSDPAGTTGTDGRLPMLHVHARSVPQACYRLLKAVHEQGYPLRTQYDRRDAAGKFIDPPGKDAKVSVYIEDPFAEPRFSPLSYSEVGKYIAEIMGAKDHLVIPFAELKSLVQAGKEFATMHWPYCYHGRLAAYPCADGRTIDQLDLIVDKLARDPVTRRAVAITAVPEIDLFMKEDMPCLRELHLRAIENARGELVLNVHTRWRSRDLYKAWSDNVIGLTNLVRLDIAPKLAQRTGRKVVIGPYSEDISSLHIYGQDYSQKGMDTFFKRMDTEKKFIARAMTSADACESLILPQLAELRQETVWRFPPAALAIIDRLIDTYRSGACLP
jgi:thymidylate synthase